MTNQTIAYLRSGIAGLLLVLMASCQTQRLSETQRFEASVREELPFRVDSLQRTDDKDFIVYRFDSQDYIAATPDGEITPDGAIMVYDSSVAEKNERQRIDRIWRNVVVSTKNKRVICIDRYLKGGKTVGFVYVLQSESKQFPSFGMYYWDVSSSHNIESTGMSLEFIRQIAVKRWSDANLAAPASQENQNSN